MKHGKLIHRKKGISSVVGAIFLILIIFSGFNLINAGLTYYENYTVILSENSNVELERLSERIELVRVSIDSGKFNLTLQNTGTLTTHLVRLWVTNETANPQWHQKYDIDYYVVPKGVVSNIGQNLSLSVNSSAGYVLKVITDRGSMASYRILPPSEVASSMSLHISPPSPVNGTQIGVLFTVSNNSTSTDSLFNLVPQLNITHIGASSSVLISGPEPPIIDELPRGSSTFFKWVYEVGGDLNDVIIFNASLANGVINNFVTANATIYVVQFAQQSQISLESESLNLGAPNFEGKLFWHKPTELDGYQMDPQEVFGQEKKTTLKSSTPTVMFYSMNSTDEIYIPAGDWIIDFHYKPKDNKDAPQLRILYQTTSWDGSTVTQNIANYTVTLCKCKNDRDYQDTRSLSAYNVTAGDKLRVSLTWIGGDDVEIKWDKSSRDSFIQTPVPTPFFPAYIDFNGSDFWLTISNTSPTPFWIKQDTRAVLTDSTDGNVTFASVPFQWKHVNASQPEQFDSDKDTMLLTTGDAVNIHFSQPRTIPTKNGDQGDPIVSGTYILYVHLIGYDAGGAFLTTIMVVGPISF